jgi:hypothetical protein
MSESGLNQRAVVTGQERLHPAIRQIARACLALARHQLKEKPNASAPTVAADDAQAGRERGTEVGHE